MATLVQGSEEEVKPSFTLRYLLLTLTVALFSAALGFAANFLFQRTSAEKKSVKVAAKSSGNLLAIKDALRSKISYRFHLLQDPNRVINSYFQDTVTVQNDGDLGIDDFTLFIQVSENVSLVKEPIVRTVPEGIRPTLSLTRVPHKENNIDEWKVALLNPREILEFTYPAYSETAADGDQLRVTLRKKDLLPQYVSEIAEGGPKTAQHSFLSKRVAEFDGRDIMLIGFSLFGMWLYFSVLIQYFMVRFLYRKRLF